MSNKNFKAIIVEGENREPQIIDNILTVFFKPESFKIITLPAGQNIYMLWKLLKSDDFETDIIEVLRERNKDIKELLGDLSRDDFSEIFLFFDYDVHQNNLGKDDDRDIISQMLESFDNETENGKLYISYPMVEALRDFTPGVCGDDDNCYATNDDIKTYKRKSSERSSNPHIRKYDCDTWKSIINVFSMRVSCLLGYYDVMSYDEYVNEANPYGVYLCEEKEACKGRVFVLSAFPEFLVDYFGLKLWEKCVSEKTNILLLKNCQNRSK